MWDEGGKGRPNGCSQTYERPNVALGRPASLLSVATREALRRRPRPRIRPRGVMEYWSVGVLRQFGIEPRVRGGGSAFRAHSVGTIYPGLKPWAKSLRPFGTGPWAQSYRPFGALSSRP